MTQKKIAEDIKKKALELGFTFVGFSKVHRLDEEAKKLESWLNQGFHGKMSYMENHFEKRVDPGKLVPGAQTVISLMYNYYTTQNQQDPEAPKISKYAYGVDYHFVIKNKLKELWQYIVEEIHPITGRIFVDSAPVLERSWAKLSGLGWIGKNTMLIHPRAGSYFFLAELIMDLALPNDAPISDYCGTCTRCIEACPTDAISKKGYTMDASRCISYLTIELKDEIPQDFSNSMDNWVFGCDICQEVCPWNRFSTLHNEAAFEPEPGLLAMRKQEWHDITEEIFKRIFKRSAVQRTKFKGLKRNLLFLAVPKKK